jgi:hypothetical protein
MSDKYKGYTNLLSCLDKVSDILLFKAPFGQADWITRTRLVAGICASNKVQFQEQIQITLGNGRMALITWSNEDFLSISTPDNTDTLKTQDESDLLSKLIKLCRDNSADAPEHEYFKDLFLSSWRDPLSTYFTNTEATYMHLSPDDIACYTVYGPYSVNLSYRNKQYVIKLNNSNNMSFWATFISPNRGGIPEIFNQCKNHITELIETKG